MKNFRDKIAPWLIPFLIFGCGTCNDLDLTDFKRHMTLITKVKDKIIDSNAFKSSNSLSKYEIKAIIDEEEYKVFEKLHFQFVSNAQDVIIFRFYHKDESSAIIKKVDKKLDMDYQFTCTHLLFYSKDKELRERISHYEQFSECRNDYEIIGKGWTYVKKNYPCGD